MVLVFSALALSANDDEPESKQQEHTMGYAPLQALLSGEDERAMAIRWGFTDNDWVNVAVTIVIPGEPSSTSKLLVIVQKSATGKSGVTWKRCLAKNPFFIRDIRAIASKAMSDRKGLQDSPIPESKKGQNFQFLVSAATKDKEVSHMWRYRSGADLSGDLRCLEEWCAELALGYPKGEKVPYALQDVLTQE